MKIRCARAIPTGSEDSGLHKSFRTSSLAGMHGKSSSMLLSLRTASIIVGPTLGMISEKSQVAVV